MIDSCCGAQTSAQDLAQLFAFGLLVSAGHCLGMCGPLVCAASLPARARDGARGSPVASLALYHAGRLASYALLGALVGALAGLAPDPAMTVVGQAVLSLLAALALLWVALGLFGVFPLASLPWAGRVSAFVARSVGGLRGRGGAAARFGLGMANGLLPCGPVYTVALTALAAGGFARGAAAMLVFGAGTVPVLVAVALGLSWSSARLRVSFHRLGAALAVAMALQLLLRGLAALEWVPHARIHEVVLW